MAGLVWTEDRLVSPSSCPSLRLTCLSVSSRERLDGRDERSFRVSRLLVALLVSPDADIPSGSKKRKIGNRLESMVNRCSEDQETAAATSYNLLQERWDCYLDNRRSIPSCFYDQHYPDVASSSLQTLINAQRRCAHRGVIPNDYHSTHTTA
jgi:hypothetical protein